MTRKVIKDTKYCQILSQGKLADAEYTYCIEKIFIKAIKTDELLQLIKESITAGVFSKEFMKNLSQILNKK